MRLRSVRQGRKDGCGGDKTSFAKDRTTLFGTLDRWMPVVGCYGENGAAVLSTSLLLYCGVGIRQWVGESSCVWLWEECPGIFRKSAIDNSHYNKYVSYVQVIFEKLLTFSLIPSPHCTALPFTILHMPGFRIVFLCSNDRKYKMLY